MAKPMTIKIPSTKSLKFNEAVLKDGTPVWYRYKQNDHYFNALVAEYGPYFISVTNGPVTRIIEVDEITTGSCEIIPLIYPDRHPDESQEAVPDPIVVDCTVFDLVRLPPGSIFIDQDGTSFIVQEVDPFCLTLMDYESQRVTIYSEVFFSLDKDEVDDCYLILPPLVVEAMLEEAVAYKERV